MLAAAVVAAAVLALAPIAIAQKDPAQSSPAPAQDGAKPQAPEIVDPGTPVEMFEDSNLDRYLRNAQNFLARENYDAAIKVLQDVIEGRTVEVVATRPEEGTEAAPPPPPGETPPVERTEPEPDPAPIRRQRVIRGARTGVDPTHGMHAVGGDRNRDPRHAVFSHDGRLYRPVRRLCQEMLARLPDIALELYRANHEVAAEELLQNALRDGSLGALELVGNRYFITVPAGKAMALLGDRLMHDGRYRAAVQVWRDLLELYPAKLRARVPLSDDWCRFKIALCLRLAGEVEPAHAAVVAMAARGSDESLRLQGELYAVKDLPDSELFARDVQTVATSPRTPSSWLLDEAEGLLPIWQYRFRDPAPYKEAKGADRRDIFIDSFDRGASMPFPDRYGPATWVMFGTGAMPRVAFLEHFRLRVADASTGLMLAATTESDEPPQVRDGQPRVRIAANDFALLRPVTDDQRCYAVLGRRTGGQTIDVLKHSEVIAYSLDLTQQLWTTQSWLEGDAGLRDVTFLAAPVVFGERLLLPAMRRGRFTLECLDRRTGEPQWNTPIHAGGSDFFKPPGCQVTLHGGVAVVATNAGCVAAVDAFGGDLRWARRYERVDPARRSSRRPRRDLDELNVLPMFAFGELSGFFPNDLLSHQGAVIMAPCDGDLLLSIDATSGDLLWYVDAITHYAPYGRLRTLIGADDDDLYALSDTHLVAIGLSGGLVKWATELPTWVGSKAEGRGRGAVLGDYVVVPGQRELLLCHRSGKQSLRRLALPAFDSSREPLNGSYNITVDGPWLALGFQGGIELFSSASALRQLATTTSAPLQKAQLLLQAGAGDDAAAVLRTALAESGADAATRHALANQLLQLTTDRARRAAEAGDLTQALQLFDGVRDQMVDREVLLSWHLERLEACQLAGDMAARSREQERLYACMEGS